MAQTNKRREKSAPDPATTYERAKPEKEAGMGRMDNNDDATPADSPDHGDAGVPRALPPKDVPARRTGKKDER